MEIVEALKAMGFYRIDSALPQLCRRAEQLAAAAEDPKARERFEAFPSFISASSPRARHDLLLSIHIGAFSSKAGIRQAEGEDRQRWKLLFDTPNTDLRPASGAASGPASGAASRPVDGADDFRAFCLALAERSAAALAAMGVRRRSIEACGVVWTNPLENKPLEGRGIGGSIAYRAQYRKGEWFLAGLSDGFDVGKPLLRALDDAGMHIKKFVICNDTPLIMKALTFADAGMAASNGINGTLVARPPGFTPAASQVKMICNAEIGSRWRISPELLTRADLIDEREMAESIESLCAAAFLPRLFCQYIISLAHAGCPRFSQISSRLQSLGARRWHAFTFTDMHRLLEDPSAFLSARPAEEGYPPEVLADLRTLARELIGRAAKLCALVAYASVANQLPEKDSLIVALDSLIARQIPFFLSAMSDTLVELAPPHRSIEVALIEPLGVAGGQISVPMLGSAHALDNLLG
jgi:hypothetical protein